MPIQKQIMVADKQKQIRLIAQFVDEAASQFSLSRSDETRPALNGFQSFIRLVVDVYTTSPASTGNVAPER